MMVILWSSILLVFYGSLTTHNCFNKQTADFSLSNPPNAARLPPMLYIFLKDLLLKMIIKTQTKYITHTHK